MWVPSKPLLNLLANFLVEDIEIETKDQAQMKEQAAWKLTFFSADETEMWVTQCHKDHKQCILP